MATSLDTPCDRPSLLPVILVAVIFAGSTGAAVGTTGRAAPSHRPAVTQVTTAAGQLKRPLIA